MRRLLKPITILLLAVVVMLLVDFNALLIWVATGPRTLDRVTPYIERALSRKGQYSVNIGETWLVWDGWKHPIDIRLRQVSVTTAGGEEFSTFPEISLGVHIPSLLLGEILPTSLTITKPVISLLQNPDRSISFGFRSNLATASQQKTKPSLYKPAVPFTAIFLPLLKPDENGNWRKLRYISVRHADVTVGSVQEGVFFNAADTNVIFRRDRQGAVQAELSGEILYDRYRTPVDASLQVDDQGIEANIDVKQLIPGTLSGLFSDNPSLKQFNIPLDGKIKLNADLEGHIQHVAYVIDGGKGVINSPYLDSPLNVNSLHADGLISNNLQDLQLDSLTVDMDKAQITASGVLSRSGDDLAIRGKIEAENVKAGDIHALWPPALAPMTREWITANVTAGFIPKMEATLNIGYGDLSKPALPKEAVDSNIELTGASITYLPEHPQISNVDGTIHVDGIALDASIASAQFLDATKLSEGRVTIADLNLDNPYIEVSLSAESTAADMVHFLSLPRLEKARMLNLKATEAKGSVTGKAKVGFYFYAPKGADGKPGDPDIDYDVDADLLHMSQTGFMNKFDVSDVSGKLLINNDRLEFSGGGGINGASVTESRVTYLFHPDSASDFDTLIDVKATAPVTALPRFNYPAFPFLDGTLGVTAHVKQGATAEVTQASIDLTHAALHMDNMPWKKPAGEAASLEISSEKKEDQLVISSFALEGNRVDVRGSAELNKDFSAIQILRIHKLLMGETNLDSLYYRVEEGGHQLLDIRGMVADVSSWIVDNPEEKKEPDFSFQHFPALHFKGDIKRVITRPDYKLEDVKGELDCNAQICKFANISGTTGDGKPFSFRILRNPKGTRQLAINADNAGAFLASLNLVDGMEGGMLSITGSYDDSKPDSILNGKLYISKHTIKGLPILAKLLSLASLTGIIDTMQGKGIQFDKSRVPFTLTGDVLSIKEAKTYGSAMGMTAEGTVTFPKRELNIEGTVVPSYTLNNVFGKLPLFGPMLTGGEGQGVFAARYSIKGTSADPVVMVNPLSFLTPGFLRGLFDILDVPDDKETPKEEPTSETPGKNASGNTETPAAAPQPNAPGKTSP